MTSNKPPFSIQMGPNPSRTSLNFLQNSQSILEKLANDLVVNASTLSFSKRLSLVRVLKGPAYGYRIVAVFRQIKQVIQNAAPQYKYFMGLYILQVSSAALQFNTVMERISQPIHRIRDVAVHPNGKEMLIVCQENTQKYIIKKNGGLLNFGYSFNLTETKPYEKNLSIIDVSYHPSGQFAVGIALISPEVQFRPFKLFSKNLQFQFADILVEECMDPNYFQYLRKWTLTIHHNNPSFALIAGSSQALCFWNLETSKIQVYNNYKSQQYEVIPSYPDTQQSAISGPMFLASSGFVNGTKGGDLIAIQPYQNHASRFAIVNGSGVYEDVFNFIPNNQNKNSNPAKCIDVVSIGSMACIKKDELNLFVTKIDPSRNQSFSLQMILNTRTAKTVPADQVSYYMNNIQNQFIQNVFYIDRSSQICQVFDLSVQCFDIFVQCTTNSSYSQVNKCQGICQNTSSSTHWDPISMACKTYSYAACNQKSSFNPYYGECALNCSKVSFAHTQSQYNNHKDCSCEPPYVWYRDFQVCRFNCSLIKYADLSADLSSLAHNECKCKSKLKFINKLDSEDELGMCIFTCPNGKQAVQQEGKLICECSKGKWNSESFVCVGEGGQIITNPREQDINKVSSGLAGWAVALIVISLLLVLLIVAFFGYRFWKKKFGRTTQSSIQLPQVSDRNKKHNVFSDVESRNTDNELKMRSVCSICNNNQSQVNCEGPCGHFYHFSCIKNKIDEGQSECPQCFKVFHNGITDMKFVDKEQDVFTISDN